MQVRRIVPLGAVAVVAVGAFVPANAATPKPISKTYTMRQLPLTCQPDAGELGLHLETITVPSKGTLTATITGFQGDWDLGLRNAAGAEIAIGGGSSTGTATPNPTERLIYKITKPGKYTVSSCNYAGSPDAKGGFTFKPAK